MPKGQDMIVSVYNIHRNPDVWEQPEEFLPERFSLEDPVPNEQNTDYRYSAHSCCGGHGSLQHTTLSHQPQETAIKLDAELIVSWLKLALACKGCSP